MQKVKFDELLDIPGELVGVCPYIPFTHAVQACYVRIPLA